jgi:hypothetical protein
VNHRSRLSLILELQGTFDELLDFYSPRLV